MEELQNMIAALSVVITILGLYESHILLRKNEFSEAKLFSGIVVAFNLLLCLIYWATLGNV